MQPPAPPAPPPYSHLTRLVSFFTKVEAKSRRAGEDEEHIRYREKMMKFDRTRLNHNLKPKANRDATSKIRQRRKSLDLTVPCPLPGRRV